MVKSKEEIVEEIRNLVEDDTNDNVISLIENVSDTITDLQTNSDEGWKQKFEDNDKMWREKYISRFSDGTTEPRLKPPTEPLEPTEPTAEEEKTFEELFEDVKED